MTLKQNIIMTGLVLGWMLSADVLVKLGNGIAQNRTLFLLSMAFCALLTGIAASVIHHPLLRNNGTGDNVGVLVQGAGRLPAMTLTLASRTLLMLLLPTGLLVSAGFAFNEIFVYWFPNFGFSFILLALIAGLHLLGKNVARAAQPLFIGTAVLCLVILTLAGLSSSPDQAPLSVDTGFQFSGAGLVGCLLLFLGVDYIAPSGYQNSRVPAFAGLFLALLLFLFWSMVSLQHVPADRLQDSTIPHLIAARNILGQPGRFLMGTLIISSTCGLVNMLFHLTSEGFAALAGRRLLPGHPPGNLRRRIYIVVFTILIGGLMMSGLAGDDKLEAFIRAALLLWLVLTGLQCFAASRILNEVHNSSPVTGLITSFIIAVAAVVILAADPQRETILALLAITIGGIGLVSAYWLTKTPVVEIVPIHNQKKRNGGST
ncbi:hypothetical protein [Desulfopila sp. IMCC35008]|uniref:hypothetical protein n=1 Tax=Desulfopila sp. IMCC35008 TaxID=2653858 RepID=UPI0013D49707|nr:hypothetical protein [Desulfopila sp. IMCC35008]